MTVLYYSLREKVFSVFTKSRHQRGFTSPRSSKGHEKDKENVCGCVNAVSCLALTLLMLYMMWSKMERFHTELLCGCSARRASSCHCCCIKTAQRKAAVLNIRHWQRQSFSARRPTKVTLCVGYNILNLIVVDFPEYELSPQVHCTPSKFWKNVCSRVL